MIRKQSRIVSVLSNRTERERVPSRRSLVARPRSFSHLFSSRFSAASACVNPKQIIRHHHRQSLSMTLCALEHSFHRTLASFVRSSRLNAPLARASTHAPRSHSSSLVTASRPRSPLCDIHHASSLSPCSRLPSKSIALNDDECVRIKSIVRPRSPSLKSILRRTRRRRIDRNAEWRRSIDRTIDRSIAIAIARSRRQMSDATTH